MGHNNKVNMKVSELIYICLDLCKVSSDDSYFTEDHVLFLLKKFRAFLIKKEQEKKAATESSNEFEYQQICLDLERVPAIDGEPCTGGYYLRSTKPIPKLVEGTSPRVYPIDFYQGIHISYIPRERMRFVGTNKFLRNIIYVSLGPNLHLYLKSSNSQFLYLQKLRMMGVFEDFSEAADLLCDEDGNSTACDPLEAEFPMEEHLVPTLIELVVKELVGATWRPKDSINDAMDNLADIAGFIRQNTKSGLQKQIEG